jgi:3',5'-cyclic AMP phosphodiesterase CpdA
MFRLAQVSDPHFRDFADLKLGHLFGKRALGALNLLVFRRRKHNMALLAAMLDDLKARPVDHLVLTGDLSNVSLTSEWSAALRWIQSTGLGADRVTVIPGNHDAYVPEVFEDGTFERMFAQYQTADLRVAAAYPFVRFRDDVALVCASSGVPTGDFAAWGRLGQTQLRDLESLLSAPEVVRRKRVLLIHHPPLVNRAGEARNLRDRQALQDLLARTGADLILHGHDHRDFFNVLPGPGASRIPVIGVGSASYDGGLDRRSRYHIYEVGAEIRAITYAHDPGLGRFVEYDNRRI